MSLSRRQRGPWPVRERLWTSSSTVANKNSVAIFAVDPGGTTGVARGLFDLRQATVSACMRRARSKGHLESWEVKGNHIEQAWAIAKEFADWHYKVHVEQQLVNVNRTFFVIEDFIPRQINFDPIAIFIIGGIETLLVPQGGVQGYEGERRQPHQKWNTDLWLKDNRIWVPSQHERDARRHLAGKLDDLL